MSKARILADLISDSQITASEITGLELNAIQQGDTIVEVSDTGSGGKVVVRVDGVDNSEFSTGGIKVPSGTTAQRDPNAVVGSLRYNTTTGFFESFTGAGWGAIATPPSITGISPSNFNGEAGSAFTIDGAFFDTDTTAAFKGADGTEYATATVTYVSNTQITVTNATNLPVTNEPFRIAVTNGAGLTAESTQGIDAGSVPAFTTAAGNVVTTTRWDDAVSVTVQATDAENTISGYAVTQGNLPAGLTLDGATGAITGTSTAQTTTTYTFTIEATDSAGNTNTRQFNIQIVNAAPVWSSPVDGFSFSGGSGSAVNVPLSATDPEGEAVSYSLQTPVSGYSISGSSLVGTVGSSVNVSLLASDGFASSVRNISIILQLPLYSFSSTTFTSNGARGNIGAFYSQAQGYQPSDWNSDTSRYNVIGQGIQVWTVPENGTYEFDVYGAYGGPGEAQSNMPEKKGGKPRRIRGSYDLLQGELIGMVVGQRGGEKSSGYGSSVGGGGGGGSFVFKIASSNYFSSALTPLVVAAGGGGANWDGYTVETLEARGITGVSSDHISSLGGKGGRGGFGGSFNYTPYYFTDNGWSGQRHTSWNANRNWRYGAPVKNANGYLHTDACMGAHSFGYTLSPSNDFNDENRDGNANGSSSLDGTSGGFGGGGGSQYEGGGGGGYWGGIAVNTNDYSISWNEAGSNQYGTWTATSYFDSNTGTLANDEVRNDATNTERTTYYGNALPSSNLMGKIIVTKTA